MTPFAQSYMDVVTVTTATVNATATIEIGRTVRERLPVVLRPYRGRMGRKAARAEALRR